MRRYLVIMSVMTAISALALGRSNSRQIQQSLREEFPEHEIKTDLTRTDSLPTSVDHLAYIPPGVDVYYNAGNCCQAALYYYKTAEEAWEHGWSVADINNQFSANFIAMHTNDGIFSGVVVAEGVMFQFMCDWGVTKVPLGMTPSEAAYDTAINYRCQNWFWIDLTNDEGITDLKRHLAGGGNAWIGFDPVCCVWNVNDSTYALGDTMITFMGGYAGTVFGYDDSHPTADGPGAFHVKCIHKSFPYWVSYAVLKHPRVSWGVAYYATDRIGYRPVLKMRARLNHPKRGEVMLRVGIGPTTAPKWIKTMTYNSLSSVSYTSGDQPFPDNNIVMDLTDGLSYLDSNVLNNIFLECWDNLADGLTGTVEYLSAEHLGWGVNTVSFNTPNFIPDYHVNTFTNVPFRYKYFNSSVTPNVQSLLPGQSALYKIQLTSFNGYADNVTLDASISPIPAQGDFDVIFDKNPVTPTDSCNMTVQASPDIPYGCYDIVLKGSDALDTQFTIAKIKLWILGSGQALCIGVSDSMLSLVKNVWTLVDTFSAMPPVLDSNYQAVIIEDGATPNDTSILRTYIQNGGNVMMTGHAPLDLCGGANLTPISSWLGATLYNVYLGSGLKIVSDYTQPFGVATINIGDTLGVALYGFSRLSTLTTGAIRLAHLGTITSVIAGLTNSYGLGHSFWYMGSAGLSLKSDSLINGFFIHPEIGTKLQVTGNPVGSSNKLYLDCYPNPARTKANISFAVPSKSQVKVVVYDIMGRRIRTLIEAPKEPGKYSISWNGTDNSNKEVMSGIYFIRLESDARNMIKKIIYLK